MSITITPSADITLDRRPSYLYSPSTRHPSYPPHAKLHASAPSQHQFSVPRDMATSHRGLPPPLAMTLPDPGRGPPPIYHPQQQHHHPQFARPRSPPPSAPYQSTEEAQRQWHQARIEEDKRRQEEEKTRQEELRLEQRRVDERMLRDAIAAGVPPHLIPIIFAGLGGGGLGPGTFDTVQQYLAQFQQYQQQTQHKQQPLHPPPPPPPPPPQPPMHHPEVHHGQELRYEIRQVSRPEYEAIRQLGQSTPTMHTSLPPQHQAGPFASPVYHPSPQSGRAPEQQMTGYGAITAIPRVPTPAQSTLPSLTTNEAQVQRPATVTPNMSHKSDHRRSASRKPSQSPNGLLFHYWTPGSGSNGTPKEHTNPNVLDGSAPEKTNDTPRKRKATGGHQRNPPPSSAPKVNISPLSAVSNASPQRVHDSVAQGDDSTKGTILVADHPFAPAQGGRQVHQKTGGKSDGKVASVPASKPGSTKLRAEDNSKRVKSPARQAETEPGKTL